MRCSVHGGLNEWSSCVQHAAAARVETTRGSRADRMRHCSQTVCSGSPAAAASASGTQRSALPGRLRASSAAPHLSEHHKLTLAGVTSSVNSSDSE